mgnify:FL=1
MKLVLIISLLFCLSLQAQQKRWQLDSIQQIQFRSDKKEYVYKTLHQLYNPKKRIVTKINDIKDSYGDDYMYICKYNKQDSLISETQYIYNKSKKDWKEIEKIVYEYSSNEIKKKIYTLDEEEWKISRIFHLEKINGKLYLKKDEYKSNNIEEWDVNTYEPYREWYYYSVEGRIYKKNAPTEEKYNEKGQVIERIYENDFIKKKEQFTYNNSGDIEILELYDGKDEKGEFKRWEKRVYTYDPNILNEEVVDKWQENDKNRTPHNAILLKEVYRPTDDGGYELLYKHQYYYSPIP